MMYILLWSFLSLAHAGSKICTEMGCESGFHLRVDAEKAWPAGTYRFKFELDGKKLQCQGKLPLPSWRNFRKLWI